MSPSQHALDKFTKLVDVVFNGRPADDKPAKPKKTTVTVGELLKRRSSVIFCEGVLYRITVEKIDSKKI